jgi:hypothetical protein
LGSDTFLKIFSKNRWRKSRKSSFLPGNMYLLMY